MENLLKNSHLLDSGTTLKGYSLEKNWMNIDESRKSISGGIPVKVDEGGPWKNFWRNSRRFG